MRLMSVFCAGEALGLDARKVRFALADGDVDHALFDAGFKDLVRVKKVYGKCTLRMGETIVFLEEDVRHFKQFGCVMPRHGKPKRPQAEGQNMEKLRAYVDAINRKAGKRAVAYKDAVEVAIGEYVSRRRS